MADAEEMAHLTAKKLGIAVEDVLVASTGVIGKELPMNLVARGIEKVALLEEGGHELAEAITTTDTFAKERAVALKLGGKDIVIGGIAKGAGMIHPNLATMLCFLATDAAVEADLLRRAVREAVDVSFNMITVDGDTSPNDMVLLLANGLAGNAMIGEGTSEAEVFGQALTGVCVYLARCIARDGEGATKLIEVTVEGARSLDDARVAARTVAGSSLVKTAVYGSDPNWGRIVAALGRSGAEIEEAKIDLFLNNMCLMERGCPQPFDEEEASNAMKGTEVPIMVRLNLGEAKATAWGCDLTEGYVKINAEYTT
jgi:glutamate N-acetyltransferase/amino-acid N-acetyltransferase